MRFIAKAGYLGLALILGAGVFLGTGHAEIPRIKPETKVSASRSQPALVRCFLATDRGLLDISKEKALFFSTDAGCQDALRAVKELPEEKRPFLVALSGTDREVAAELEKAGLSGADWCRCKGDAPTITVPSLVWVEGNAKKECACSAAVELLTEMKYPVMLAEAELSVIPGNANSNAVRAMMSFSGAVVNPGEEFSFYRYVGVPSEERGYMPARSLIETPDGPLWIEDIGGGICKAATLLNSAVRQVPGLKVTERHHHARPVSYAPEGQDVAVARSSGWDYRFRNNRERPVKIQAYWDNEVLRIQIWELAKPDYFPINQ